MVALLSCRKLKKSFHDGDNEIVILDNVDLDVNKGETLAILGSSGSGKSTLLHILGTLDVADSGELCFDGDSLLTLSSNQQASFRNQHLGFVYQFHHLLSEFSARENVAMPLLISGQKQAIALKKADEFLELVGLSHRRSHKPFQLSGGERQRVAIARSLINEPQIVLADEPTGNLDDVTSQAIVELIKQIHTERGTSFVIVTHDHSVAAQMQRTVKLTKGKLSD